LDLEHRDEKREELAEECARLTEENSTLSTKISALLERTVTLSNEVTELSEQNEKLSEMNETLAEKQLQLSSELADLISLKAELSEQNELLAEQNEDFSARLLEAENQAKLNEVAVTELTNQRYEMENEYRIRLNDVTESSDATSRKLGQIEENMRAMATSHSTALADRDSKIERLWAGLNSA